MPVPELKHWEDARGRRRVTWPGRKGFPVMLRKDETPLQAYERTIAKEAAKAAEDALKPPKQDPAPALDAGAGGAKAEDRARPPGSDPKPRGGRPIGRPRPTDAELAAAMAELLVLPAIPMGLPVRDPSRDIWHEPAEPGGQPRLEPGFRPRCAFCRDHFIQTGPEAAAELVKLSQQSEPLRRVMEQLTTGFKLLAAGSVLATYVAKPLMHHVAPVQALEAIGPVLGVPAREPAPAHSHDRGHAAAAAPGSPAAAPA